MRSIDAIEHMLPPRVIDPSRIDAIVHPDVDRFRLSDAVASLAAKAMSSVVLTMGSSGEQRSIVLGRPGARRILDRIRFPYGERDLAFCSVFREHVSFSWSHMDRPWVMSVATSSTIGLPAARLATRVVTNVIDTVTCIMDVACGRTRGVAIGGETADRIRTTARLANLACCQSGDPSASMNFADERVVGAGRPLHPLDGNLTLSAQGSALVPRLPSTVLVSLRDLTDDDTTFVDIHAPMIAGRMPDDPMERLRMSADAEGLPILYRWLGS